MQASTPVPGPPVPASVRLTRAQKRDLFGMGVAAVITTALIAVPAVLPLVGNAHDAPPAHSIADTPPLAPAVSIAQPVTVARVEAVPAAIQRTAVPAQRRLRATSLPPAIRRVGLPSPAIASGPAPTILAANVAIDRSSRPLARRFAGFLTGDGTYSVRPFPTVSADRD